MSTDTICEAQAVTAIGFVFTHPVTSTSSGEAEMIPGALPKSYRSLGASDFWGVVGYVTTQVKHTEDVESALVDFAAGVVPVANVVALTYAKERHAHLVWTFIQHRDRAVRKQIYARERALMARYPALTFDFNVIALDQSETGALVPDDLQGRVVMYRPRD